MLLILVFGLMSTVIIPSCEGNKWIGTFKDPGSCDLVKCCCPLGDLNMVNDAANAKGSLQASGVDCAANDTRTVMVSDLNANSTNIPSVGLFSFDGTLNKLEVTLDQKTANPDCKVTMERQVTVTIAMTVVVPTAAVNNSAGGGATTTGNADTTTKPKPSKASLNHDTNLIKILSIIMVIVTIIHI
ncbi:unnamed protein product [Adineta steineri]|uniref:Uncharacterized protein n=1 Tax=Adineta steineri TaxID=433720 RepID=A0A818JMU6_9BILA|nr:unnamed protein product [Adineta steineri]CAF3543609.1 unnamed protein product [Adineta steineri]